MNERRLKLSRAFTLNLAVILFPLLSGCGVRGRPQPPLVPAELGRGQPTFRRATEEFAFPAVPAPDATPSLNKKKAGETN